MHGSLRVASAAALLSLAVLAGAAPAQRTARPVTVEELGGGLSMLQGVGGNVLLSVGEDGAFLVDDQYPQQAPGILARVRERTDAPLRFVLNTHWHGDHSGGNAAMAEAGALIVAHQNVRTRMSTTQLIEAFGREVPPSPVEALPVLTFSDRATFHWNGHTLEAIHVGPAHTDGDVVVRISDADLIHTGDVFFNGFYPFMDSSSGGRLQGMIEAATAVLGWAGPETRIIPGHGPLANREDLEAYRDMLAGVSRALRPMIEAGMTVEEVVAAKPTAPWDARWGGGFLAPDAWVRIVYDAAR